MKSDVYLKAVLTVIAVALVVLTLQAVQPAFSSYHGTRLPDTTIGRLQGIIKQLCNKDNPCHVYVRTRN